MRRRGTNAEMGGNKGATSRDIHETRVAGCKTCSKTKSFSILKQRSSMQL